MPICDEGIRMGREYKRTSYREAVNLTLPGDFLAKPAARMKKMPVFPLKLIEIQQLT